MPAVPAPSILENLLEFFHNNSMASMAIGMVLVQLLLFSVVMMAGWRSGNASKPLLDPATFKDLVLASKTSFNHNTVHLRFEFEKGQRLGLPIGQHISFKATGDDGKDVYRSYTPTSDDDLLGAVEFVIKLYPMGKMSQIIDKLEIGQTMAMKGPKGRLVYHRNMKKHIGMLAGGSGITPMYQVLHAILKDTSDKTKCSLVFGNVAEEDILLRQELDALAAAHPTRFSVRYLLNSPPAGWTGGVGFINAEVVQGYLPIPSDDTLVLYCGPPPMVEAVKKVLTDTGFSAQLQFGF